MIESCNMLLTGAFLSLLLVIVVCRAKYGRSKLRAPRMGINPGPLGIKLTAAREEFRLRGHRLVNEGYYKARSLIFSI